MSNIIEKYVLAIVRKEIKRQLVPSGVSLDGGSLKVMVDKYVTDVSAARGAVAR